MVTRRPLFYALCLLLGVLLVGIAGLMHPILSGDGAAQLTPRIEMLPASGHTAGDLLVLVADCDVCFAGDLCFFGVTPLAFQGDPAAWADMLDVVVDLADVIVPGHGPIGGDAEVRELQGYLRACVAARGDVTAIAPGLTIGFVRPSSPCSTAAGPSSHAMTLI